VAGAWWVVRMKEGLSEEEFWLVVGELDACWRGGGEFEREVCEFRYSSENRPSPSPKSPFHLLKLVERSLEGLRMSCPDQYRAGLLPSSP